MFSSAMRMRHAMAYATHKFFNDRGFVYTHTPLITAADCEGAGEQFVATTMLVRILVRGGVKGRVGNWVKDYSQERKKN
jgi:aspartyl/asparaginyl-tRNA synthetase